MALNFNPIYSYCFPFFISITSLLVARWLIKTFTKSHSHNFPPCPQALPIIGHGHLLSSNLPESLQTLAQRYGPLMQIHIGPLTYAVVSNAALAKQIFTTHDADFASRYEPCPSQYNIYNGSGFVTGPYGTYWRFMKNLCVSKLFAGPQIDRFKKIREQEIEKLLKVIMNSSREGSGACNLGTEVTDMTNNLIFRMIMNKRFLKNGNDAKLMRKLVVEMMVLSAKLGVSKVFSFRTKMDIFGNGKKLREIQWRYDEFVEQMMKDYEDDNDIQENRDYRDLMGILLETYRDTHAEVKLTRKQIKYFVLELFLASVDGISTSIQWAIAELMKRPEKLKMLREKIDSVVGLTRRLVNESDVSKLPFLQAVLKETLRLHPLGSIVHRECIRDCKINGFDVKAKTRALVNAYAIMRDPDEWNGPDEFRPERFLNGGDGYHHDQMEMDGRQDFCYIPFGGGSRGCVGRTHANLVMHTTIGALVQCFDWKINGGDEVDVKIAVPLVCYPITRFDPFA